MDPQRFDRWVRSLLTARTRRSLAGTGLAALLGRITLQEVAAASCKQGGKACAEHDECCTGRCRAGKHTCTSCTKESVCAASSACGPAGSDCECYFTTEGKRRCVNFLGDCSVFERCKKSSDCGKGAVCTRSCCEKNLCVPLCGNLGLTSTASRSADTQAGSLKD
jgi:hypothetical protein